MKRRLTWAVVVALVVLPLLVHWARRVSSWSLRRTRSRERHSCDRVTGPGRWMVAWPSAW